MELKQFKIDVLPLREKLLNYARKLTEDPSDAEDAVHEVMLKLWNMRQVQAPSQSATPERLLEEKDEFRLMREIIDSLPSLQRTIIQMKDVQEYETDEIAEITGCNPEAIRSNLSRARKKVRDIYLQTIQERKRRNEA